MKERRSVWYFCIDAAWGDLHGLLTAAVVGCTISFLVYSLTSKHVKSCAKLGTFLVLYCYFGDGISDC